MSLRSGDIEVGQDKDKVQVNQDEGSIVISVHYIPVHTCIFTTCIVDNSRSTVTRVLTTSSPPISAPLNAIFLSAALPGPPTCSSTTSNELPIRHHMRSARPREMQVPRSPEFQDK